MVDDHSGSTTTPDLQESVPQLRYNHTRQTNHKHRLSESFSDKEDCLLEVSAVETL